MVTKVTPQRAAWPHLRRRVGQTFSAASDA